MSLWFKQAVEGMIWSLDFLQVKALCHIRIKHFAYQILVSEVDILWSKIHYQHAV